MAARRPGAIARPESSRIYGVSETGPGSAGTLDLVGGSYDVSKHQDAAQLQAARDGGRDPGLVPAARPKAEAASPGHRRPTRRRTLDRSLRWRTPARVLLDGL